VFWYDNSDKSQIRTLAPMKIAGDKLEITLPPVSAVRIDLRTK